MIRRSASWLALLVACAGGEPAPLSTGDGGSEGDVALADVGPTDLGVAWDGAAPDAGAVDLGPERPGFDAARWRRSVIYFVMTDRFVDGDPANNGDAECYDPQAPNLFHGGDFAGLRQHLDYLEALGADALWITPVPLQVPRRGDWCGYHGYWADLDDPDPGQLEPHLGREEELHGLIEDLHHRDQRLLIDLVVNHPGRQARITQTRPEWFHPWEGCAEAGAAELYCDLSGLPDFAHEQPEVAAYLTELSASWMRRFNFDGIRMDTVKHVPVSYFADHFVPAVLAERPELYLMGEIFDEGSYNLPVRYRSAGFHGFFDFPLRRALIQAVAPGGSLAGPATRVREVIERLGIESALLRPTFLDNHDVPRFAAELSDDYTEEKKAELHRLALSVLFLSPGIPQLYMGDELGAAQGDNRQDFPSWAFDPGARAGAKAGFVGDPGVNFDHVAALARLRRELPALHDGHYQELWRPDGGADVWAFYRKAEDSRVIVAFNGGDQPVTAHGLPIRRNPHLSPEDQEVMAEGRVWTQVFGHPATLSFEADAAELSLGARGVVVFKAP
ncbi:MAG: DUF3459 domain-containing protein [Deltaproteobacteria bacterium]|nr:DUF3459 domain-containing protein [Deltaproteobacteria bacterium]